MDELLKGAVWWQLAWTVSGIVSWFQHNASLFSWGTLIPGPVLT